MTTPIERLIKGLSERDPAKSREQFQRLVEVGLGCEADDERICGRETSQVILFDIKENPEEPQGSKDIPINVCPMHSGMIETKFP